MNPSYTCWLEPINCQQFNELSHYSLQDSAFQCPYHTLNPLNWLRSQRGSHVPKKSFSEEYTEKGLSQVALTNAESQNVLIEIQHRKCKFCRRLGQQENQKRCILQRVLSAEVNSYLFNNARWLQPACECLSKSLLSITGSGIRNPTRQPLNALVSLHCQLSKRTKLPEEQSCEAASIASHSRRHNYPWLTEGKSKTSKHRKNNNIQDHFQQRHQQSTTVFAGSGKKKKKSS